MTKINYNLNSDWEYSIDNKINIKWNLVNENKNITDHKNIFKEKVSSLLWDEKLFLNINEDDFLERALKFWFKEWLNSNNSFFEKYSKLDEYELDNELTNKIKKYLPIHEQILYKVLNEEIEKLEKKDKKNIKNAFHNLIKKYFYIMFIFSEKIKLSDLEKNLSLSLEELSFDFASAKMDIQNLNNFWDEVVEKLGKRFDINEENKSSSSEKFFATMYRRLYKEIWKEWESNKWLEIWKKLENEIKIAFEEIFYIFETWIEFGFKDDEKLKNLQIFTRKIVEWILYFKKQNIAFNDFEHKNFLNSKSFINSLENNILSFLRDKDSKHFKSDFKDEFLEFLESTLETKENWENIKENLILKLKEKTEKIAKSRIPEETKYLENLDIENVDFTDWKKIPESQKYNSVFSQVIAKNGKIEFADFLEFKNEEKFKELFELYYEYYAKDKDKEIDKNKKIKDENKEIEKEKTRKIFRESLEKQFEEVKNLEWMSVKDFIENDVNNLNLLILWWRFILKIRFLEKNNLELNIENIKTNENLKENEYWVVEKISERLKEENVDILKNVIFSIDWKVRNTSQEKDFIWLNELINSLKKWIIDLSKEKIKLINGEEKIIWSIHDLYLPKWITSRKWSTLERDLSDIESFVNGWIDLCYKILRWDNSELTIYEESYGKVLLENKIIRSLNPDDFSIEEKDNLQKFANILKFIKNRRKYLIIMMKTAESDKEKLEENKSLKRLLNEHSKSGLWPDKAFHRAYTKLIDEYGGNFNKLWDLTRARVVSKDLDENIKNVVEFIKTASNDDNITNVSIVDSTWEPISIPKKDSWYRDIKIFVKLKSWNTMEVQFQVEEMYKVKDEWIDLNEENNENKKIFEKMEKEWVLLNQEDLKELLKFAKERNIILPTKNILEKMMWENTNEIDWNSYENILKATKITTDYTYNIARQLKWYSVWKKLTRLERILADSAWSKIVLKYLKNKEIQVD